MRKGTQLETISAVYTIEQHVGSGGAGHVYRAKDEAGQIWAVKVLDPSKADRQKRKRFRNELAFAEKKVHPNILSVDDSGLTLVDEQSTPFYVTRFYEESLKKILKGKVDPTVALQLFSQILDGIEAAHLRGVIHRDLKPANILHDPQTGQLVIADFGIARFTEDLLVTLVATEEVERLANFEYAAPEQRRPGGNVDQRSDIFALGLILYELLMGEVPHGTGITPIASRHPSLAYLDDIVDSMRAQNPDRRPNTVSTLKTRLNAASDAFLSQQKISRLDGTVVKENEIDDPLALVPPSVADVRYDDQNRLIFLLSRRVNPEWFAAFRSIGYGSAVAGTTPPSFSYHENAISIVLHDERHVEPVIEQVKRWLPAATSAYRRQVEHEQRIRDKEKRRLLTAEREREEHRRRMLDAIKRASS
jgi:serine/threonine protein kinase